MSNTMERPSRPHSPPVPDSPLCIWGRATATQVPTLPSVAGERVAEGIQLCLPETFIVEYTIERTFKNPT